MMAMGMCFYTNDLKIVETSKERGIVAEDRWNMAKRLTGRDGKDSSAVSKIAGRGKLILGSMLFFGLTLGIFVYQFSSIPAGHDGPSWSELRWGYLILILLVIPTEPLAAGLRIWLLSRVLHPGLDPWTCIKTDLANIAVSMLTPSQTGGGAAHGPHADLAGAVSLHVRRNCQCFFAHARLSSTFTVVARPGRARACDSGPHGNLGDQDYGRALRLQARCRKFRARG